MASNLKIAKRGIKRSFKAGKAKRGVGIQKGSIAYGQKGVAQKAAGKAGAAAKAVGKAKKTFKKEFKAQAMSDQKANNTFGSRKSAAGAAASKMRQRSAAGKVGAKVGGAFRMTAARKAALMKAVRASAAKRRGKKRT